jgi:hypothetical protein
MKSGSLYFLILLTGLCVGLSAYLLFEIHGPVNRRLGTLEQAERSGGERKDVSADLKAVLAELEALKAKVDALSYRLPGRMDLRREEGRGRRALARREAGPEHAAAVAGKMSAPDASPGMAAIMGRKTAGKTSGKKPIHDMVEQEVTRALKRREEEERKRMRSRMEEHRRHMEQQRKKQRTRIAERLMAEALVNPGTAEQIRQVMEAYDRRNAEILREQHGKNTLVMYNAPIFPSKGKKDHRIGVISMGPPADEKTKTERRDPQYYKEQLEAARKETAGAIEQLLTEEQKEAYQRIEQEENARYFPMPGMVIGVPGAEERQEDDKR